MAEGFQALKKTRHEIVYIQKKGLKQKFSCQQEKKSESLTKQQDNTQAYIYKNNTGRNY